MCVLEIISFTQLYPKRRLKRNTQLPNVAWYNDDDSCVKLLMVIYEDCMLVMPGDWE